MEFTRETLAKILVEGDMEPEWLFFSNQARLPFEVLGYHEAYNMCLGKSDTEFEGVANQ